MPFRRNKWIRGNSRRRVRLDQAAVCAPIVYCEIKHGCENVPV